jgi:hypothetical protein
VIVFISKFLAECFKIWVKRMIAFSSRPFQSYDQRKGCESRVFNSSINASNPSSNSSAEPYDSLNIIIMRIELNKQHPKDMGKREIEMFLSHLATKENVSASTQRQALNAIIYIPL